MKKKKTYEISVIDKTYSKTISDKTKFYASDTALELVFKLKETEYAFESAEIVLLNTGDRSRTTRPVPKVDDDFVYEIDDDVVTHYGDWLVQLIFEQAGEFYVSSPVKFRIENDLSNEHPPQLSDIYSWTSLKRYADKLTEDLKQAVLSVESMDDTFNTNETVRQTTFETAEQSRQDTFETNESERAEAFESNETTRQSQELEREKSEVKRQSVFDGNEANRTETFNTNEATRQLNETSRQQAENQRQSTFETNESERQTTFETAEQERQSAEQERVSAEEQRKTDHANRSTELAGKADKVVIENLVENGDFENGLNGWRTINGANVSVTSEGAEIVSTNSSLQLYQNIPVPTGNILYTAVMIKSDTPKNYILSTNQTGVSLNKDNTDFQFLSITTKRIYSSTLSINATGLTGETTKAVLKYMIGINLTDVFGAGNEPTKEEMDKLIETIGYIDGEYTLNNKEMLSHLMKGIGEKADKKQEDWITPTLLSGSTSVDGYTVQYRKNEIGTVELRGRLSTKSLIGGSSIINFPSSYITKITQAMPVLAGTANKIARLTFFTDGRMTASEYTIGDYLILDNVSFTTD